MTAPANTMRSVQRALDLLNVLQTYQHPVRLSDLARHAGLHIATVQRMLNVLVDNGFAVRYASGYTAGPAALSIAHAYLVASPLNMIAQPIMQELSAECGLTSSLYVPVAGSRVLVARVEGANPLRYTLPVGERFPLYLGAAGKSILAFMDDAASQEILADVGTIEHADGTVKKISEFRAELTESAPRDTPGRPANASSVSPRSPRRSWTAPAPYRARSGSPARPTNCPANEAQRIVPELRRAATAIGTRYPVAA